jgi:sugar phosphate isomerase/epimerase
MCIFRRMAPMISPSFSVILGNVGSCSDRFLTGGYGDSYSLEQLFDRVAGIEHVTGVELVANWHVDASRVDRIKANLDRTGLRVVSIIPDHFGQRKWGKGAFCSRDHEVRQEAIAHTKEIADVARALDCDLVSLWPGQDGYDYYFQSDYIQERQWYEEGIKECCRYRKDVKVAIEYKIKEPRNRSFASTVAATLLMVKEIDETNCGITLDYGHAVVAYENAAESVALLKKYGDKLFHIHMNDNYGLWDDDMIVGSVHTIPYLEFFYWLDATDYRGWISIDQYPYREDGQKAVDESVQWLIALNNIVNTIDRNEVKAILSAGDAIESSRMLRKLLLRA